MDLRSGFLLLLLSLFLSVEVHGSVANNQFVNLEVAERFADLTAVLRCPKCPNQSLSDSDAIIAKDLRQHVKTMLAEGHSDAEIRAFMVQRYGDFILYDPPLKASTLVLWFAPVGFLLVGILVVVFMRRRHRTESAALSVEEQAQLVAQLARSQVVDHPQYAKVEVQ